MFIDLFVSFAIALIITLLFVTVLGWRPPGREGPVLSGFLFFFFIITFAVWAGGVWLRPVGPMWLGMTWIPAVIFGIIIAILLMTLATASRAARKEELAGRPEKEAKETLYGGFFWVLLMVLAGVTLAGYLTMV